MDFYNDALKNIFLLDSRFKKKLRLLRNNIQNHDTQKHCFLKFYADILANFKYFQEQV